MNYHPEDFLDLMEAVEEDGGLALPEPCTPRKYTLSIPDEQTGKRTHKDYFTTGCENTSRYLIPYQLPEDGDSAVAEKGNLIVCLVDDNVGSWPKYRHAISDRSRP